MVDIEILTAIVGAITGIAGSIMGYISLQRLSKIKSLDLRLELKKAETQLILTVNDLPDLLTKAKRSREAISSAIGQLRSGGLKKWIQEWETDHISAKQMISILPNTDSDYTSNSQRDLETKLILIHQQSAKANALKEKYEIELERDEKQRDRIYAERNSRNQKN